MKKYGEISKGRQAEPKLKSHKNTLHTELQQIISTTREKF